MPNSRLTVRRRTSSRLTSLYPATIALRALLGECMKRRTPSWSNTLTTINGIGVSIAQVMMMSREYSVDDFVTKPMANNSASRTIHRSSKLVASDQNRGRNSTGAMRGRLRTVGASRAIRTARMRSSASKRLP